MVTLHHENLLFEEMIASRYFFHFAVYYLIFCGFYIMAMTKQQMKTSLGLLKKNCMPKNDVTEEHVGDIDKGKFIEDRNVMCYIACIYTMGQGIKNNKIQHDAMIKQVDMMFPSDMKGSFIAAINQCRGVAKNYKDICEAAFWTAKCIYEVDPANFVFA